MGNHRPRQSFMFDGKRYYLNPKVPTGYISWRMAKVHVGTSDEEVRAEWTEKLATNGYPTDDRTAELVILYALKCHRDNQKLYRAVVSGRL